jgi:hypothetical protein
VIYLDKKYVLYTPLTNIEYDKNSMVLEAIMALQEHGAWISSKGAKLKRHVGATDEVERQSRQQQRDERPEDFPVQGVLLRGIKGLKYSFSYLVTDSSKFEWTECDCPTLREFVESLPFEKIGRVNIQTVEPGHGLHKHIDSVFRMDTSTVLRRKEHLSQYGITNYNQDIDCFITLVLQGSGINFHFERSGEDVCMKDELYYFCPHLIQHSIDKCDERRIICRIEGKASTELIDIIQRNAKANKNKVLTI